MTALDDCVIPVIEAIRPATKRTVKKKNNINFQAEIEKLWEQWRNIYNNGNENDPFNTDGWKLNYIRNTIEHYIKCLKKYGENVSGLTPPPPSDENYMARPNTIRQNARKALEMYKKDENLQYLLHVFGVSKKERKITGYNEIVNYYHRLENAIALDNLIEMRFLSNTKKYRKEFKECANKLKQLGKTLVQKTLF